MYVSGILLAAGRSARMGCDKLSLPYGETTVFHRSLSPLIDSPLINEVVVVVNRDFEPSLDQTNYTVVINENDHLGMASSLRVGILAAAATADAYIVCLADMPRITVRLLRSMIETYAETGKGILLPTYKGRDGHPVIFGVEYKQRLLQITGDIGARQIIRDDPSQVKRFPVDDPAVVFDIDTAADMPGKKPPAVEPRENTQ